MAVWVSLLRVLIASILIGTFLTPTFLLSLGGTICAILLLSSYRLPINLSPIAVSVLASMAHLTGQFYSAYLLFIQHHNLFFLLPILLTIALIVRILTGIINAKLLLLENMKLQ